MKRTFLALAIALALGASVEAQTPKEVLEPYKAYRTALEAKDEQAALSHSKAAWEAAEEHLGDHKTTGDLAQNYAVIKTGSGVLKSQIIAMERAMDLALFHDEDANDLYLQRGIKLLEFHSNKKASGKVRKLSKNLVKFAKENERDKSVLYGEILILKSTPLVSSRKGKALLEITSEALDVFENPSDAYPSAYPIFAHLYDGFGHEYEDEVLEAALSYQKVMDYVGKLEYETNPIVGRALGRWSHMRSRLEASGELESARAAGLCDCWPYDIERNETVKPIKRVLPVFPSKALRTSVSGYTIVQFDLDDNGNTKNQKKIVSWPPNLYEKAALKSLKKWEYSPRAEGETDADRTNLITTIRFEIRDRSGKPVY